MLDYNKVPVHYMKAGVKRYVELGDRPGSFLCSLFADELVSAYKTADTENTFHMREWAEFVYWELPLDAWGSRKMIDKWVKHRGLAGIDQQQKVESTP